MDGQQGMDELSVAGLRCPNCKALNPPGTIVCSSCGVNLAAFDTAMPKMQMERAERSAIHSATLAAETTAHVDEEVRLGQVRFQSQLRWLGITLIVLIVCGGVLAASYVRYQQARYQRRTALYEEGVECLHQEDFECALTNLEKVFSEDPDYPGVRQSLRQTRSSLWSRAIDAGDWSQAVSVMEAALKMDPHDVRAAWMLKEAYRLWLRSASRRGDWGTFFRVLMRRQMHSFADW
jgi:tetratricopeptide (TPR) repeat protein